ncbi:dihydroxyacid dehydratase/phosphogluconate dehydratase [Paenibacillus popilliae]|uniref:Dihydroxyacid dehydratase/phosphogluconate dehydratase n=1 Tax=Paenibacillus popilliae ATCC 14706 TaxID=1212764 RepID=M9M811_PAEPP|nr:dihydroxyacid dehydratase/phosphogluconate dehydratase [Paenibacillus popilliae]GAC43998.1 dihydroxyacid dehydratase/phosphogluconate dehydratase [Paenibacillus popilliae ATCC 14706]
MQPDKPGDSVTVMVNGCKLDEPGLLIGGVTYAPVRAMAEAVGAKVSGWVGEERKVEISKV